MLNHRFYDSLEYKSTVDEATGSSCLPSAKAQSKIDRFQLPFPSTIRVNSKRLKFYSSSIPNRSVMMRYHLMKEGIVREKVSRVFSCLLLTLRMSRRSEKEKRDEIQEQS